MNCLSNIFGPRTPKRCLQLLWRTAREPPAHQPLWSMKTFFFSRDTTQKWWYWHLRLRRESIATSQAVWLSKTHKRRAALRWWEDWLIDGKIARRGDCILPGWKNIKSMKEWLKHHKKFPDAIILKKSVFFYNFNCYLSILTIFM